MSVSVISAILAPPTGVQLVGGGILIPQTAQFATFQATASSNTGGNLTFNIPSGIAWLTNPGSSQSLSLAKGQYLIYLFCGFGLNASASAGSYGDIGVSQGGTNIMQNRYNFNGFGGGYLVNMNASTAFTSDGTNSSTIAAFCTLGNTSFNSNTPSVNVRIVKVG